MNYRYSVILFWLSFYCLGLVGAEEEAPAEDKSKRAFYALFWFDKGVTPLPKKQGATKEEYERMVEQKQVTCDANQEELVFTVKTALRVAQAKSRSMGFNNTNQASPLPVRALADLPEDQRLLVTCVDYKNVYADGAPQDLAVTFPALKKVSVTRANTVLRIYQNPASISQESLTALCGKAGGGEKPYVTADGACYEINGDGSILSGHKLRPGNTITDLAGVVARVQKHESGLCLTFEGSDQGQKEVILRYSGRTSVEAFLEKSKETAV